ncbi:MAG: methyltransferase domain-containing protein [Planctomycetes bacterium]|nr:methyltransferase domain-containing protein [Planctomycetota bacterium]
MAPRRSAETRNPACYAQTTPGLETVAAAEIRERLGGEIVRTASGLVVFRVEEVDERLLELQTVEDVFLLAWGTNDLTRRAADLDLIENWTAAKPDWPNLLKIHHAIRPKPKGTPSYWLVVQQEGRHVYQRHSARKSLIRGLGAVIHPRWKVQEELADLEIWLSIHEQQAVCGVRLSDRTMRHRQWKKEHRPASLRPVVAAAMARQIGARPGLRILDPMCGVGTVLAESLRLARQSREKADPVLAGGDIDPDALQCSAINLRSWTPARLCRWNARRLPLADGSFDAVACNLPFGKQYAAGQDLGDLYGGVLAEADRVLVPGGVACFLTSEAALAKEVASARGWKPKETVHVEVLGQRAAIMTWRIPADRLV